VGLPYTIPTLDGGSEIFIRHKLLELQYMKANTHLTLTNTDSCIQLTFYPIGALAPTLHLCNDGRYFLTYTSPSIYAQAAMAKLEGKSMKVKSSKIKDPSIEEIGDPRNLNNYLPDLGATQHMTRRLADLQNTVEGQKLGVEVADGHIIKCSTTGNTKSVCRTTMETCYMQHYPTSCTYLVSIAASSP
jgi:hypothetical protein